jgi:hypothetical protein
MDPDAALEELLCLVRRLAALADGEIGKPIDRDEVLRVAELVEALNSWLTGGGFLPQRWKPASRRSA